jgi:hypothetical protein
MVREEQVFEYVMDHLSDVNLDALMTDSPDQPKKQKLIPIKRTSFNELNADFEGKLFWSDSLRYTLAVSCAVHLSVRLPGDMVWMHIVGPPSSGKSTILDCINADSHGVFHVSKATGLYSGMKGEDCGLIPKINRKLLVIKDLTTTLSHPGCGILFGQLRDIYDGYGSAHYMNGEEREYSDVNFAVLTGVTDVIHSVDMVSLGERFLMIDLTDTFHGSKKHTESAITGTYETMRLSKTKKAEGEDTETVSIRKESMKELQRCTLGFLEHIRHTYEDIDLPGLPGWFTNKINAIAQLISFIRKKVSREKGDLLSMPRREMPLRLATQFTKLSACLGMVLGKDELDAEVFNMIRKVAFDTLGGDQGIKFKIFQTIAAKGQVGITKSDVCNSHNQLTAGHVQRELSDLQVMQIIDRVRHTGTNGYVYKLSAKLRAIWEEVKKPMSLE